jgi:hypothetical protein
MFHGQEFPHEPRCPSRSDRAARSPNWGRGRTYFHDVGHWRDKVGMAAPFCRPFSLSRGPKYSSGAN